MEWPTGPALVAAIIVALAVVLLGGIGFAFQGSIQF
jgi:hypothetical protein